LFNPEQKTEMLLFILTTSVGEEASMHPKAKHKILVVDDERSIRTTVALLLESAGYDVSTAENGFDALLRLRDDPPDLIVSDLNMPQMSGFEFLSVVRRRFPELVVVATSGAYSSGEAVPGGVIADAFYAKGASSDPGVLVTIVADLLNSSATRRIAHRSEAAPVWIPRNGKDSTGKPYVVLTCTQCLRSFPLHVSEEINPEVVETPCIFCLSTVRYVIDFSISVASPVSVIAARHA
jgi:CheY-like chemotaxis protein